MITVDFIDRPDMIATVPMVCMHCEEPTCALVCPADAIKRGEDGVVRSALKPRCIGCSNCVLACPFGVPKVHVDLELMMKCDMCYDRTSVGLRPMCATVCPSQALTFVPPEQIVQTRREQPVNVFQFGKQTVKTKVSVMLPSGVQSLSVDAADYTWEEEHARGERSEEAFMD